MKDHKPTIGKVTPAPDDIVRARAQRLANKRIKDFEQAAKGVFPRTCPVCDYKGMFVAFGFPPRFDAQCPGCRSLERHRLMWLFLDRSGLFAQPRKVLHFAPEPLLEEIVSAVADVYETSDLFAKRDVTHRVNIEDTGLPDAGYDVIICSHVLEHVDDAKALSELYRMLVPGGVALLATPVVEGWATSYENPDIDGEKDRLLHFGQGDHVRYFGRDIRDRIRKAGFALEDFAALEPDVHTYGLQRGETLFVATKPADRATKDD